MRKVFHVMRTYGSNGGEKQLAQMFSQPAENVEEHFVFLYHDAVCEQLFRARTGLIFHRLWPFALKPRAAWGEMAWLVFTLPLMQIALLALLVRHRPQVCVVHGFQGSLVAWPSAVLLRCFMGFAYFHRTTKSRTGRNRFFRLVYAPYHKLLGVSMGVRDSLKGLAPDGKLDAIANGVDVERVAQVQAARAETPAIITIGRLMETKGQRLVIEAFMLARALGIEAQLWIVGDGEDEAFLRGMIGDRDDIHLLGRREDIPQLLAQATVFCHASQWEGMSNAVLEAMAARLASVVVDAPGVSECHIDGVTGMVVPRDAHALAVEFVRLLKDEDTRRRMGDAALTRVREHYSMQANRQKFLALYAALAGGASCAA